MSEYETYQWESFFISYRPWGIFLPEKISADELEKIEVTSSEIYLVQDEPYDGSHEDHMEEAGAYGEVTFDQEPVGQTGEEIAEILAEREKSGFSWLSNAYDRVRQALYQISNGRNPLSGTAFTAAVSALTALLVLLGRKGRRRRKNGKKEKDAAQTAG